MATEPLATRLLAIFAEELEEQLAEMHAAVAALRRAPADSVAVSALLRVTHTLKGAARAAGATQIEQLCHALETDLAEMRDTKGAASADMIAVLLEAADALAGAREKLAAGEVVDGTALNAALQSVRHRARSGPILRRSTGETAQVIRQKVADATPSAIPAAPPVTPPAGTPVGTPVAPPPSDDRTKREDSVRIAVHHVDAIAAAAAEISALSSSLVSHGTDLADIRSRLREQPGTRTESQRDVDRLLARATRSSNSDARALAAIWSRLEGAMRNLRQRPMHELTDSLERVARDVARDVAKKVQIDTTGGDIEADRVVVEGLREPMLHLIRNAVDHGIESPEDRVRAGKPETGMITLSVRSRGDRVIVTLADDGNGLDLESLRAALKRAHKPVPAANDALMRTIFDEGLSTAEKVTTLSGRGVGLSIVKSAVERFGGTVDVSSRPGKGTTFTLDVPVSIATMRALLVAVGEHTVAIPSSFVQRAARVAVESVKRVGEQDMLTTDDHPVRLRSLASLLGPPYTSAAWDHHVYVLMLTAGAESVAIVIDDLLDERELVIRPLEHVGANGSQLTVGSALVNTGEAVLVLSVPALMASARTETSNVQAAQRTQTPARAHARVLVVDDSITSRTLEQSVLAAAGYDVTTAVDALEAWRKIERTNFALVVSDVEMPHMDGIALCERIRSNPRTANIPVVLVTSLDQPQHRARGLEAGADAYVAKGSFDQDELLETVNQLIGRQTVEVS